MYNPGTSSTCKSKSAQCVQPTCIFLCFISERLQAGKAGWHEDLHAGSKEAGCFRNAPENSEVLLLNIWTSLHHHYKHNPACVRYYLQLCRHVECMTTTLLDFWLIWILFVPIRMLTFTDLSVMHCGAWFERSHSVVLSCLLVLVHEQPYQVPVHLFHPCQLTYSTMRTLVK